MDVRHLRRHGLHALSAARVGVGVSMLARPATLAKSVGVDSATAECVSWVTRMVGAREVALGAGTLLALRRGRDVREWALAQAFSDAVDAAVFAAAVARGHARPLQGGAIAAVATSGAATALAAWRDLEA
jgi:hypothetical protein